MPYYSSPTSTSTGYSTLHLSGPYANHSSIIASNFTRPSPTLLTRSIPRYKPHLATITESSQPLRRIDSPKIPSTSIPRPIKINTADIDVSVNKYRKFERSTKGNNVKKEEKVDDSRGIKRNRPTVRLHTVHEKKSWRESFGFGEILKSEERKRKKTPGEILKEKHLIRGVDEDAGKQEDRSLNFHEICRVISSDKINEDLNPGQPEEVKRKQSRQFSCEDICKQIRRCSAEIMKEELSVLDAMMEQEKKKKCKKKTSGDDSSGFHDVCRLVSSSTIDEELNEEVKRKQKSRKSSEDKKSKVASEENFSEEFSRGLLEGIEKKNERLSSSQEIFKQSADATQEEFCVSETNEQQEKKKIQKYIKKKSSEIGRNLTDLEEEKCLKTEESIRGRSQENKKKSSTEEVSKQIAEEERKKIRKYKTKKSAELVGNQVSAEEDKCLKSEESIRGRYEENKKISEEMKNEENTKKNKSDELGSNKVSLEQIPNEDLTHGQSEEMKKKTTNKHSRLSSSEEIYKQTSDITQKEIAEEKKKKTIKKKSVETGRHRDEDKCLKSEESIPGRSEENKKKSSCEEVFKHVAEEERMKMRTKKYGELVGHQMSFEEDKCLKSEESIPGRSEENKKKSSCEEVFKQVDEEERKKIRTKKCGEILGNQMSFEEDKCLKTEELIPGRSEETTKESSSEEISKQITEITGEAKKQMRKYKKKKSDETLRNEENKSSFSSSSEIDISQVEIEEIKTKPKPIITSYVDIEATKPTLKAVIEEMEVQEIESPKSPAKLKLTFTVGDVIVKCREKIGSVKLAKSEKAIVVDVLKANEDAKRGMVVEEKRTRKGILKVKGGDCGESLKVKKSSLKVSPKNFLNLNCNHKDENENEVNFWDFIDTRESVYYKNRKNILREEKSSVKKEENESTRKLKSKRSLVFKTTETHDPDMEIFETPEEEPKEEEESGESKFVPLQSNRLSQWMHPFQRPEQFDVCPVEIFATPKTIRKRHYPRPRHGGAPVVSPVVAPEDDSSEEETSDSDEDEEDEEEDYGATGKIGASTSSNDSGFDSAAPGSHRRDNNKDCDVNCHVKCEELIANLCGVNQKLIVEAIESVKRGSVENRDSPTSNHAHNPAFALDVSDAIQEEVQQSSTYIGFKKSGRITPPATTIPRFRKYNVEDFNFLKVLGKGSFGKVLLAELKNTEYYYAIKCLKKDVVLEDDDVECTLIERKVLALGTRHPYLCHLLCTFQTESHLFFVMEYLNGGDLMFHIQQSGRFPEPRARFYAAEIVSGLKFLHNKGIVYRDLKLDNILLDFDGHVRIADFGMCKLQIFLDRTADTFCGTPDYMAPEIIKGQHYNQCVDWWSFGVLLYEMLLGQSPFSGCDEDELFWSICNERPVLPKFLSAEAVEVLTLFLEKDASKRLGCRECPAGAIHDQPFFRQIQWDKLEERLLEPPFKPNLLHPLDTQYFDRTFTVEKAKLTPIDKNILQSMDQTQFQGFSYTNPNATDK